MFNALCLFHEKRLQLSQFPDNDLQLPANGRICASLFFCKNKKLFFNTQEICHLQPFLKDAPSGRQFYGQTLLGAEHRLQAPAPRESGIRPKISVALRPTEL